MMPGKKRHVAAGSGGDTGRYRQNERGSLRKDRLDKGMEQKISDSGVIPERSGHEMYAAELKRLLDDLQKRYDYDELNALLVLKDILASVWKSGKKQSKRKNKRG